MIKQEYKYSDITKKIIGCAMKVHSSLGNGFQEVIYQRALAIEMNKNGLSFEREMEMGIYYDNEHIGTRSVDRVVITKNGRECKYKGKMIAMPPNQDGYPTFNLCYQGKVKPVKTHRIVAEAFIPNPNNYTEINHIDENKANNEVSNLE